MDYLALAKEYQGYLKTLKEGTLSSIGRESLDNARRTLCGFLEVASLKTEILRDLLNDLERYNTKDQLSSIGKERLRVTQQLMGEKMPNVERPSEELIDKCLDAILKRYLEKTDGVLAHYIKKLWEFKECRDDNGYKMLVFQNKGYWTKVYLNAKTNKIEDIKD